MQDARLHKSPKAFLSKKMTTPRNTARSQRTRRSSMVLDGLKTTTRVSTCDVPCASFGRSAKFERENWNVTCCVLKHVAPRPTHPLLNSLSSNSKPNLQKFHPAYRK